MDEPSENTALINYFGDTEMIETSVLENMTDISMAENEIIAGPSTVSEIINNPVAFVNSDNAETRNETGFSSVSEGEVVAGPSAVGDISKYPAFKQKATKESIKKAIELRSRVPVMVAECLDEQDETDGVTLAQIKAYIGEKYKVHVDVLKSQIREYLKKNVESGIIMRIRGANGAYKYKIWRVKTGGESASTENST